MQPWLALEAGATVPVKGRNFAKARVYTLACSPTLKQSLSFLPVYPPGKRSFYFRELGCLSWYLSRPPFFSPLFCFGFGACCWLDVVLEESQVTSPPWHSQMGFFSAHSVASYT